MELGENRVYRLFRKHHKDLYQDLWDLIEKRDPKCCWRWMGDHDADGFAVYTFEHEGSLRTMRVHRYLYYAIFDELPKVVEHECNNRWCCNMNHLSASLAPVLAD